jgi:methionyl aminopeptidase
VGRGSADHEASGAMTRSRFHSDQIELFTDQDSIEHLVNCGGVLSRALTAARGIAAEGVTPIAISEVVEEVIRDHGADPLLLGLKLPGVPRFPAAAAVCVNDVAVNGVPSDQIFRDGDIVTIDSACEIKGFVTDAAISLTIGANESGLVAGARKVLGIAVESVRPGKSIEGVSSAALACAQSLGLAVADEALLHGVGKSLHAPPAVFWNLVEPDETLVFKPGMVLAIEPVVVEREGGTPGQIICCQTETDGWSRRAPKRAAFEERTILVTEDGCRDLTPIPAS